MYWIGSNLLPRSAEQSRYCTVTFITGSEYDGVFLSTYERTDKEGKPLHTVRSICNKYVFNTVITRPRSLIVAFGNPSLLINGSFQLSNNCWSELIQRCITCQSFHVVQNTDICLQQLPQQINELHELVFSHEPIVKTGTEDKSNEGYRKLFLSHKDERIAAKLVKNPKDIIGTKYWYDSDDSDIDEEVATGQIVLLSHRKGKIVSDDPTISGLTINLAEERRCHFNGQKIRVTKDSKRIVIDVETVREANAHFGQSFLCQVREDSMILFYPFDKTIPVLCNMPTLTKTLASGVVCFHPNSIDDRPRANNFIPKECAIGMVFTVTYLRWRKSHRHPLGIVTGAFPCGNSVHTGDRLLKLINNIPVSDKCLVAEVVKEDYPLFAKCREFNNVITIDPKGSRDHDDALSCTKKGFRKFEIGVHITDVQAFVQKDSEIDKVARERGCSVYSSTAECVSNMLPLQVVEAASILPDCQPRDSFSVTAIVVFSSNTESVKCIEKIDIVKSRIVSKHELTYEEAQESLFDTGVCDSLHKDMVVLWGVACHLRQKRLGAAAKHLSVREDDEIANPEAHVLVEELMIWANKMVAEKLFGHYPVIHRSQSPPNSLEQLITTHSQHLAVSLDLQQHIPPDQESYRDVQLLHQTIEKMAVTLKEGNVRVALHQIQFEHLQPQVAVAHALFNMIRERASYCVAKKDDPPEKHSHDSLRCDHYTHFTSPIRRYTDLVIQRILLSVLIEESNGSVDDTALYEIDELQSICSTTEEKLLESDRYEKDRLNLDLALQLQQSSHEYICFVKNVEKGELTWTFPDVRLKTTHRFIKGIKLKHLNAAKIPKRESSSLPEDKVVAQPLNKEENSSWKVKIASAEGTARSFFSNPFLVCQSATNSQLSSGSQIEINMFTGVNDEPLTKKTNLKQQTLCAAIHPFTQTISADNWKQLQIYVRSLDTNCSVIDSECIQKLLPSDIPLSRSKVPSISESLSPLWVYKLHRPLQSCEVLRVQLTGCFNSATQMISPTVQLLEVGPNLRVCIQHNNNPAECFTSSSKPWQTDGNIKLYFRKWEQALLAEAATASILDTELLIITDVKLKWPQLNQIIDPQGHAFYQLPVDAGNDSPREHCVCMKLGECFVTSSYDFFDIHAGDLMCVRCFENDGDVRAVFHMVVKAVDIDELPSCLQVYLRFVGERANYISPKIQQSLHRLSYEVQFIPLTLPFR